MSKRMTEFWVRFFQAREGDTSSPTLRAANDLLNDESQLYSLEELNEMATKHCSAEEIIEGWKQVIAFEGGQSIHNRALK